MAPYPPAQDAGRRMRLRALKSIYAIYARFARSLALACTKGCAACCTCDVTATALETDLIRDYMAAAGQDDRLPPQDAVQAPTRFRPQLTTNEMARRCAGGEDVPPPSKRAGTGRCPLLVHELCSIYPARPFGCRCLVSTRDCRQTGYSQIDDFTLTVNSVFLQYIEHLDAGRPWGNLIDMLYAQRPGASICIGAGHPHPECETGLLVSRTVPVLMVPPEHRERIEPILAELSRALSGKCNPSRTARNRPGLFEELS